MPRFLLIVSALMLIGFAALAQSPAKKTEYIFKGQLVDADSGMAVPHAHITNPYKGLLTVSQAGGAFTMPVEAGDTLIISNIGYVTLKYPVPATASEGVVTIELQPKTEQMEEVVITKFPSEARFKEQILGLNLPDEGVALDLPAPVIERRTDEGDPGGVTVFSHTGAISGFANKFNNKERGRQFKARMAVQEQNEAYIATKFNKEVVQNITGLEDEEKLNEFMKFCVMPDDFLMKASEYEIHEAVLGCFKDFIASK
ncbi:carboxypeptidase-like regulatory domain-containing protein [Cesiribacter sp. SM1]|uniref:carboxypeptidase-like regulatory domain-containing protein n=1 Tax=Cesiribacter sp. SM1 TaxID=2861196 RepID=UPI001CD3D04A|nr:carboxypeptidase-like regulatory domain-containing protein [Cesiribacter sp. SM1]